MCVSVDILSVSHECVMDLDMAQPLSLASNFAQWPLAVLHGKKSLALKSIFPFEHCYTGNVCLSVLLTGHFQMQTSSTVSLFKHATLIYGGFVFVNYPSSQEK